jgi:hypothetical protein
MERAIIAQRDFPLFHVYRRDTLAHLLRGLFWLAGGGREGRGRD